MSPWQDLPYPLQTRNGAKDDSASSFCEGSAAARKTFVMKRTLLALATALLAACGQPAEPAPKAPATAGAIDAVEKDAVLAALNPVVSADLGKPAVVAPATFKTDGDWAWVIGTLKTPDGAALKFADTTYAAAEAEGFIDPGGSTYALLKREGGAWTVTRFVVAPTDMAWLTWPQEYGAPAALLGVEPESATDDVQSGPTP